MFAELYQTGERVWFLAQVKSAIYKELTKIYRESFISPWWRLMFKTALEKYVAKLANSYQHTFPRVSMTEIINSTEHLMTKNAWEAYLNLQAEKLANLVLEAEDKFEKINEGYILSLNKPSFTHQNFIV